jgi:hypothetical protein
MAKWKVAMPRTAPAEGKAQVVLAIKTASGLRTEVVGEYDEHRAGATLAALIGPGLEAAAKIAAAEASNGDQS